MNLHKSFFRVRRMAVCVAFVLSCVVATNAQSEKTFNLSEFNPVGNGVADDGPALQKALDALADAGGGTLLIPAGTYKIITPVAKDFSSVNGAKVTIRGVPSDTMPAPVTAPGNELAAGLNLTSEIIPATGKLQSAITLTNLHELTIEHVGFTGIESSETDAFITLYFINIDNATIRHCEFYGLSSFGVLPELGGGNVIRAVRTQLSIELSVFLGCTANSGAYAPLVENLEWRRFSISNSIFIDYGLRTFYSKTGIGAPLSWIGIENAAPKTPDSPRREVLVRDTFLDEGGWVGISVLPYRWAAPPPPIDLIYISGLKMNVANMGTTGHLIYDVRNILIENSHYGWSRNAYSAIDINRVENAIFDKLTCIDNADRLRTDDRTGRLAVINSIYNAVDSLAGTTTVLQTEPDQDPVQYVRQRFVAQLGRQPDPAAHFYWSDLLIRCDGNEDCVNEKRAVLNAYLSNDPQPNFSLTGTVTDENGDPLSGASISLAGSETLGMVTDSQGKFQFSGLPTSGSYTITANKRHYDIGSQTFVHPASDVTVVFNARLHRHSIEGRVSKADGKALSEVTIKLAQSPSTTVTTDDNGFYSLPDLAAGQNYTVVPVLDEFAFDPVNTTVEDLSEDRVLNFTGKRIKFSLAGIVTDENGDAVTDATVKLSGSQSSSALTDPQGSFEFSDLSTEGSYTVEIDKRHHTFTNSSQTFVRPTDDVMVVFNGTLNRHSITGRLTRTDGTAIGGVAVELAQFPATTVTTDATGAYSFSGLMAGETYTIIPSADDFVFGPLTTTFEDLSADRVANFVGKLQPGLLTMEGSEFALALDSVSFAMQPFSIMSSLGFSTDGFIRVIVFAKNVQPVSGPSPVSVIAKDDNNQPHPLEVEYVGDVAGQSWLKQLNLKLPANSLNGKCVQMKLTVAEVDSNEARLCVGTSALQSTAAK